MQPGSDDAVTRTFAGAAAAKPGAKPVSAAEATAELTPRPGSPGSPGGGGGAKAGSGGSGVQLPEADPDAPRIPDYQITGRLGEGGMGVVWRAVQLSTRRPVALKLLGGAAFGSDRARSRFQREVELAARLEHPSIARVYDSGIHRGISFYAMELVEGVHLDEHVRMQGLDKRQTLRLMKTICEAIQHAHQRGVIHRDLKPSNILVSRDGRPVVVDFGLAKTTLLDDAQSAISIEGQIAGTPAYMSPEQAAGKTSEIDTRTDVYSLGVILYRLLTGESPHDLSGSSYEVLKRIADGDVRRPRLASKDASRVVDRELESLLLKAMAKEPNGRYASAAALAQDIDNYLDGEPLTAKRATTAYFLRKRIVKHKVPLSVAAALLVVLMVGGGWAKFRPAKYVLDSEPVGAKILVNGKQKPGCTVTPCFADLPYGRHEIRLSKAGFQDSIRVVEVDWGAARILTSESWTEAVRLAPDHRTFIFVSEPVRSTVTVRDAETGEPFEQAETPCVMKLPLGFYTVTYEAPGHVDNSAGQRFQVTGSIEPFVMRRELMGAGSAAP